MSESPGIQPRATRNAVAPSPQPSRAGQLGGQHNKWGATTDKVLDLMMKSEAAEKAREDAQKQAADAQEEASKVKEKLRSTYNKLKEQQNKAEEQAQAIAKVEEELTRQRDLAASLRRELETQAEDGRAGRTKALDQDEQIKALTWRLERMQEVGDEKLADKQAEVDRLKELLLQKDGKATEAADATEALRRELEQAHEKQRQVQDAHNELERETREVRRDLQEATTRLKAVEAQLAESTEQLTTAEAQAKELLATKEQLNEATKKLEESDAKVATLRGSLESSESSKKEAEQQLHRRTMELEAQVKRSDMVQEERDASRIGLTQAEQAKSRAEELVVALQGQSEQLKQQLEAARDQTRQAQAASATAEATSRQNDAALKSATTELHSLKSQLAAATETITKLKSDLVTVSTQLRDTAMERDQAKAAGAATTAQLQTASQLLRDTREEAALWKSKAEEANGKVQKLGLDVTSQRERLSEAVYARDAALADAATKDKQMQALANVKATLDVDLRAAHQACQVERAKAAELQAARDKAQAQADSHAQHVFSLQQEKGQVEAKVELLTQKLTATKDTALQTETELSAKRVRLTQLESEHERQAATLAHIQQHLEDNLASLDASKRGAAELEAAKSAAEALVSALRGTVATLEVQLTQVGAHKGVQAALR